MWKVYVLTDHEIMSSYNRYKDLTDLDVSDWEASVDDLSFCDGHVVVVHLVVVHLPVHVQRVRRLPQHLKKGQQLLAKAEWQ